MIHSKVRVNKVVELELDQGQNNPQNSSFLCQAIHIASLQ